jgi:hypothetical protein
MAKALQKTSSALLALLLAIATGWQGAYLADAAPVPASKPVCKCCDYDPAKCATPACCVRPTNNNRAPVVPAVPRPASGTERHAVAVTLLTRSTLPRFTLHDLSFAPPPIQAGAVPIFQRDCSFLI